MTCEYVQIQTTVNSEDEAKKLIMNLFENNLIACAQYFPIKSYYWWKGELENADEILILIKTHRKHFEKIKELFKRYHPYELPGLVCICFDKISDKYKDWISKNT